MLHCGTVPIIESSSNLGFCCLNVAVDGLQQRMDRAKLSVFHNYWSEVWDFTPGESPNWSIISSGSMDVQRLQFFNQAVPDEIQVPNKHTPA
jgi:Tubulin binding cofactor C